LNKYSFTNNKNIKIKGKWFCRTSFNQNLFLSTDNLDSSIYQYEIFPTIQLFKECSSPHSCTKDE
jgi:hypothetical protein